MSLRVTMRDIARRLGVSPMTVSRALRGDGTVSADTRTKVVAAADALGYVYDSTAQAFRTQKSGFIAVTLPSLNNANFADTYRGLADALRESGLQMLLGATNYRTEEEERILLQLLARNPQAVVLTGGHHSPATRHLLSARDIPVVEIWDLPEDPLGYAVGFSNRESMQDLVRYLAQSGRGRLGFVGADSGADSRGGERRVGVQDAARALGLPDVVHLSAGAAPVSMQGGADVVERLGARITEFDALICVSDPVAFGVLSACRRLGINVPGQLAVTGFGNFEIASVSEPGITTIEVAAYEIGQRTAQVLQAAFAGQDAPAQVDVGARLILRETS